MVKIGFSVKCKYKYIGFQIWSSDFNWLPILVIFIDRVTLVTYVKKNISYFLSTMEQLSIEEHVFIMKT